MKLLSISYAADKKKVPSGVFLSCLQGDVESLTPAVVNTDVPAHYRSLHRKHAKR